MSTINFQPGSALAYGDPTYIQRKLRFYQSVEEYALGSMEDQARDIIINGPRQVGKSSLLAWLAAILKSERGYATAVIDMMGFGDPELSQTQWLQRFWNILIHQLGDDLERDMSVTPPELVVDLSDRLRQLTRFIRANRIAILFDEAEVVPEQLIGQFYKTIRTIVNQRKTSGDTALAKFRFAYAGVFEPEELLKNNKNSPFNVAIPIWLDDFNLDETRHLVSLLEQKHNIVFPEDVIPAVYFWTDGHPFLVQSVADILDDALLSGKRLEDFSRQFIQEIITFVEDHNGKNLLNPIRNETIKWIDSPYKKKLVMGLIQGEDGDSPGSFLNQLRLLGTVKQKEGQWLIRNRLVLQMLARELNIPQPPDIMFTASLDKAALLAQMLPLFNDDDFRTLCFELDVNYDNLGGQALEGKTRELIIYLEKQSRLPFLLNKLKAKRPNINWSSI